MNERLSVTALHERAPHLIVCDIFGHGHDGPYRDRQAHDLLIRATGDGRTVRLGPQNQHERAAFCASHEAIQGRSRLRCSIDLPSEL